LETHLYQ